MLRSDPNDDLEVAAEATAQRVMETDPAAEPAQGPAVQRSTAGRTPDCPAPDAPAVQRSPRTWRGSREVGDVRALRASMSRTSRWPPVIAAVREYGHLDESDLRGRSRVLSQVEQAVDAWHENQRNSHVLRRGMAEDKRSALFALSDLVSDERAEIQQAQQQAPPAPSAPMSMGGSAYRSPPYPSSGMGRSPSRGPAYPSSAMGRSPSRGPAYPSSAMGGSAFGGAAPMSIGGRGRERADDVSYGNSASPVPDLRGHGLTELRSRLRDAGELPRDVTIDVHFTKHDNVEGIQRTGLRPSRGRNGIGLPDELGGGTDRENFYVVTGAQRGGAAGFVNMDSGGERATAVLRGPSVTYQPDLNYGMGGQAAYYPGNAPPARRTRADDNQGPISFVLPLRSSGRTAEAVTAFINSHRTGRPLTPQEAEKRVHAYLLKKYGISIAEHLS